MGFKRGSKIGAENIKGHRWINWPNSTTTKCTKCGIIRKRETVNYSAVITYIDNNGIELRKCPDCL